MMILNRPKSFRTAAKTANKPRVSINSILRAAYRRHARGRLTEAAVKRCLGDP